MSHARTQHPNARLTPRHRRNMVDCVLDRGWTVEQTAERFQVDPKTVRKWRDRFLTEGEPGLQDRSSRPRRSPNRTPRSKRQRVIRLRKRCRWGADHIGHELNMAASTVQAILRSEGMARLDRGDRATNTEPVVRYQRDRPGELVHVDIKKIAAIPDGGGWKIHGRGNSPGGDHQAVGYRYIHTAVDDRTRIAYSEIHNDEQSVTAAQFWARAVAWFTNLGVVVERVLTDNGSCYRSALWHQTCADLGVVVKKTRPRRPQTNGKVERFHRILLEEWAYIRDWTSEGRRAYGYRRFIHFYNHHRSHGALDWATPMTTLNHLVEDNLPTEHS